MNFVRNLIFSASILLISSLAYGQELPLEEWSDYPSQIPIGPMQKLPEGTIQTINKTEYTCYNIQEYKDILLLANDYQSLYDWRVKTDSLVLSWHNLDKIYLERLANRKEQIDVLKLDRVYALKQLEDQRKYVLELQNRREYTVLGWKVVSAIELVGIVALSITAAVK